MHRFLHIAVAFSFFGTCHALVVRSPEAADRTAHASAMPTCMSLDFSTLALKTYTGVILDLKFTDVLPGIDATVSSNDYLPTDIAKTGIAGTGLAKINMAAGVTSTYTITFRDKAGATVVPPCFQFSILDIDCAKNGCQKLTIDMAQFPAYDVHLHPDTLLQTANNGTVASFFKTGTERSPNPEGVPLSEEEQENTVEFVVAGVPSFSYSYTSIDGSKGSSTYLAGHSGVGPEPVKPTPNCPYGGINETMGNFLPTSVYPDSAYCPAGKTITVCSNPEAYGIFNGYSAQVSQKLANQATFGPNGVLKYAVRTVKIYPSQFSVQKFLDEGCDLFWIGANSAEAGGDPISAMTQAQLNEIVAWSKLEVRHVVLAFQRYPMSFGDYGPNAEHARNPMIATELGESFVKNGPFGDASTFNQAGSWQGRLTTLDEDACVLVRDSNSPPDAIMALDLEYNAIVVSDNGIFTSLSGAMSTGSNINWHNANDRLFGNFMGFIMGLICQGPPANCEFQTDPFERCLPPPTVSR